MSVAQWTAFCDAVAEKHRVVRPTEHEAAAFCAFAGHGIGAMLSTTLYSIAWRTRAAIWSVSVYPPTIDLRSIRWTPRIPQFHFTLDWEKLVAEHAMLAQLLGYTHPVQARALIAAALQSEHPYLRCLVWPEPFRMADVEGLFAQWAGEHPMTDEYIDWYRSSCSETLQAEFGTTELSDAQVLDFTYRAQLEEAQGSLQAFMDAPTFPVAEVELGLIESFRDLYELYREQGLLGDRAVQLRILHAFLDSYGVTWDRSMIPQQLSTIEGKFQRNIVAIERNVATLEELVASGAPGSPLLQKSRESLAKYRWLLEQLQKHRHTLVLHLSS